MLVYVVLDSYVYGVGLVLYIEIEWLVPIHTLPEVLVAGCQ